VRTYHDAKAMARSLRADLATRQLSISHSEALEIVAHQFGLADWNVLAARIADDPVASVAGSSDPVRFGPCVPILRIFSVEKAMEFYLGFLGFALDWEHRFGDNFPLYAQVSRAGLKLHLSEHHGDGSPGSAVFLPMVGVDALHRELLDRDYAYAKPGIETDPWGRNFEVADPFGNRLRFTEAQAS